MTTTVPAPMPAGADIDDLLVHLWDDDTVTPDGRIIAYCGRDTTDDTDNNDPASPLCPLCALADADGSLIVYDRRWSG